MVNLLALNTKNYNYDEKWVLSQNRWAPTTVCRADEGVPIHIGDYSNIQDEVISHAIDAVKDGVNNKTKGFLRMEADYWENDTRFDHGQAISSAAMWVSLAHD